MRITGDLLIGSSSLRGEGESFRAVNPATGDAIDPLYGGATEADLERACSLAWAAFDTYRETGLTERAHFLEMIAQQIVDLGDTLIERACLETGLARARIEGECARTVAQLRLFGAVVREASWLDVRIDPAQPERKPAARPDLRLRNVPVGPVAVFGASNFPLAFSTAGGDTASALAAGSPVVVKAHPAHPGTSELVGRAVQAAVAASGLPEGVFSVLFGTGNWLGGALVADRRIKAVGFTGSRSGGLALLRIAQGRPEPIPVYAEMSSINPIILLPAALAARGEEIGAAFVASLTMGAGQFCTNPGLLIAVEGVGLDQFVAVAKQRLEATPSATMLTPNIFRAYQRGVEQLRCHADVSVVARGQEGSGVNLGRAVLFATTAETFLRDESLKEEVFGASSLLVRCRDIATVQNVLQHLEGQLTVTLHMDQGDLSAAKALLQHLERKAGRLIVNGWPTGVEVAPAMVHGGPFPATSDGMTTSVGTLAIRRFLRPVCYQDFPQDLLPELLRDGNPASIPLRFDGTLAL